MKNIVTILMLIITNLISCNNSTVKKNQSTDQVDSAITNGISKIQNKTVSSISISDSLLTECLDLSDTTRVFKWLRERDITPKEITYYQYASEIYTRIYPINYPLTRKLKKMSCGYFFVTTEKGEFAVFQVNGELIEQKYAKNKTYIDPPILGDTCCYSADQEEVESMFRKFKKAVSSGERERAEQYLLFPIVSDIRGKITEIGVEDFWRIYDSVWINLVENKKSKIYFLGFGSPIMDDTYQYDRTGIRYCKPAYIGDYNKGWVTKYTCGYYSLLLKKQLPDPEVYSRVGLVESETYNMRIIKVDGELKICSFFFEETLY